MSELVVLACVQLQNLEKQVLTFVTNLNCWIQCDTLRTCRARALARCLVRCGALNHLPLAKSNTNFDQILPSWELAIF